MKEFSSNASGFFHELRLQKRHDLFREEYKNYLSKKGKGSIQSALFAEAYYHVEPHINKIRGSKTKRRQEEVIHNLEMIDNQFLVMMNVESRFRDSFVFPEMETVRDNQLFSISHNHVTHRLEGSYMSARSYGLEYVYPLWDIDLLQFYLNLPVDYKFRNGMGRAIFRESLKDIVPDEIRLRNDKSISTIPTARMRIVEDYENIQKLILSCKTNNKFHYLDYSFLLNKLEAIKQYTLGKKGRRFLSPRFISALQVLQLQDMQRSGEFDSGIKI